MNRFSKELDLRKLRRDNDWRLDISSKQRKISSQLIKHTSKIEKCPICLSKQHIHLISIYNYPYNECTDCGHVFSTTPPNPQKIASLYTEDDSTKALSVQADIYTQKDLFAKRVKDITTPKVEFVSQLITERGLWIDVGAGVGDLVLAASNNGWNAKGYDSDKSLVEFAQIMGANVEHLFLSEKNMGTISGASVISTINLLEHIIDPKAFFNSIASQIKIGTYYLFEVPRFPSISTLANICFPNYAARNIYPPDHLHIFSDYSVELMIENAGLEKISTWFFGQDIYELIGNCLLEGNFKDHVLIDKVLSITNDLQKVVDKEGLSDTMLILTQKVK